MSEIDDLKEKLSQDRYNIRNAKSLKDSQSANFDFEMHKRELEKLESEPIDDFSDINNTFVRNLIKEYYDDISGISQEAGRNIIKSALSFLRRSKGADTKDKGSKNYKSQETKKLKVFVHDKGLSYNKYDNSVFLDEGSEQKVFFEKDYVIKINDSIFYSTWEEYLINIILHNYFFPKTKYELLGFTEMDSILHAVVKQVFIKETSPTDFLKVKEILAYNGFKNTKNNDYYNSELGIILEDLHDENVLTRDGIPYFIDTVFYMKDDKPKTPKFKPGDTVSIGTGMNYKIQTEGTWDDFQGTFKYKVRSEQGGGWKWFNETVMEISNPISTAAKDIIRPEWDKMQEFLAEPTATEEAQEHAGTFEKIQQGEINTPADLGKSIEDDHFAKEIKDLYSKKSIKSTKEQINSILKQADITTSDLQILENWEGEGSVKDGDSKTGILHEFFTPYWLCYAIGDIVKSLGIPNPKVLDPAMGTGRLINNIKYKKFIGFEVNKFNFDISNKLYYGSDTAIYNQAFETAFLKAPRFNSLDKKSWLGNDFDLVVSNPPYGEYTGQYKSLMPRVFTRFEFLFVALSMSLVKKGGYGIFVLPQSFMNNGNMYNKQKEEILKYNTFIDAIRLPNSIFATTDIGVDLLLLQKK
jgi:hypothetical protein